ncbi:MAG: branched-chain amino acid ABC transporter permease [Candidatus Bathyarchaeia archaeon]
MIDILLLETLLLYGAITGAVYALLALGFTLIYGVAEVVNMAHGALFMLGAYMFFTFSLAPKNPPLWIASPFALEPGLALIAAMIFVGIVGSIIYVLFINPVIKDTLASIVVTVALAIVLQQVIYIEFGGVHRAVFPFASGSTTILGVTMTYTKLIAFGASLILFAIISLLIGKSKIGKAMRATAQDRETAMLMGINTTRICMLTMFISASLAALAGILISGSTSQVATPQMWLTPLSMSFAIVILGGLGSIKGTLIGAFIVGYAENAVALLIPGGSFLKGAVALAIMVSVLLIRPKGLFGKRIELEE